jgi:hypothetical protein
MSLNQRCLRLAIGLVVLLIGLPAFAQNMRKADLFSPADISPYGGGPQPNEGYFFAFDGLNWHISTPSVTPLGADIPRTVYYGPDITDSVVQTDSHNTGWMAMTSEAGIRVEFGRMGRHRGWIFSTYQLTTETQTTALTDVVMTFVDPPDPTTGRKLLEGVVGTIPDPLDPTQTIDVIRDLPLTFDTVYLRNSTKTLSVELMAVHRFNQRHYGGFLEVFAGVRYLEFDEDFAVNAIGSPVLGDSIWSTEAENHIIGPQVNARWFRQSGRWMLSTEGRFMVGFNSQSIRQDGTLGTQLPVVGQAVPNFTPLLMKTTSFNHVRHIQEWSPLIELRTEVRYQLTRSIALRAGWTGIWMDGIARASNLINYEVPYMGLRTEFNEQDVFVHGPNFGITINR